MFAQLFIILYNNGKVSLEWSVLTMYVGRSVVRQPDPGHIEAYLILVTKEEKEGLPRVKFNFFKYN